MDGIRKPVKYILPAKLSIYDYLYIYSSIIIYLNIYSYLCISIYIHILILLSQVLQNIAKTTLWRLSKPEVYFYILFLCLLLSDSHSWIYTFVRFVHSFIHSLIYSTNPYRGAMMWQIPVTVRIEMKGRWNTEWKHFAFCS